MKILIKDINVAERQRKNYGDIKAMADSLARFGLLHPIILDQDNFIVAGCRRLEAAKELGWTEIDATRRSDLDDIARRELELEENVRRKDLEWPEEVRAVRDLFRMRQQRYGGEAPTPSGSMFSQIEGEYYSLEDAAEEFDRSRSGVHLDIRLADALDDYPVIEEEKSKVAAWKRYMSWRENKLREEMAKRTRMPTVEEERDDGAPVVTDAPQEATPARQPIKKIGWKGHGLLYQGDARDVLRYLPAESIDCIITDPPFGLKMFKEGDTISGKRLAQNVGDMYDDDPHEVMDMLDEVFMHASRVLKPDGFVYCFFHMTRYETMFLMLRKHFGTCDPVPIVWIKNTPGIGDPNRTWVYAYEPFFFIARGARRLVKPQAFNHLKYDTIPPGSKIHPTEKPIQLLRHIVLSSCVRGEVVLDPFAGSGSTLVAAYQSGCRFMGIERHEPFHRAAVERISEEIAKPQDASAGQEEEVNGNQVPATT